MRKIALRFFDTKALGIACSLVALTGLLGCFLAMSAMADGARQVNLPNTTVETTAEGQNITFSLGDSESVTMALTSALTVNTPQQGENNIVYQDGIVMVHLTHYGEDNACDAYNVTLSHDDQSYPLSCVPGEGSQEFFTENNFEVPQNVNMLVLQVSKKGVNPQPGPDTPTGPVIVNIAANSFGEDNKTATFQFGEQNSRSITFNNAWNTTNNPHFEFESGSSEALRTAFTNGLGFTANDACMDGYDSNDDPHDNYYVRLESQGGWGINFACNEGTYTLPFTGEENLPAESYTIRVMQKQQPQQDIGVEFENVSELAQDGSYIKVTSRDIADKTFIITPSSGTIACNTHDNETHCEQRFESSPFDENSQFFYYISVEGGEWDPETMMVFLRGAAGLGGIPSVTKVGNDYEFMLKGAGIPADTNHISIAIETPHEHGGGDDQPQHEGDPVRETTVTIKSNQGNPNIANSFYLARISINDMPVSNEASESCEWSKEDRENPEVCPVPFVRTGFTYNKVADVNTVEISFGTIFNLRYINDIIINGTTYSLEQYGFNYEDRQDWLAHYDHQMTGFTITDVPYNEGGYVIEVDVDELDGRFQQIGNFLWSNDEREKEHDEYIGHSNLEVMKVKCHITENDDEDVTFNVAAGEQAPEGCVFEYEPDSDRNPTGSLVVPEGSEVTVRVKPIYGWQVTSFKISGDEGPATDPGAVAQYTFGIRRGNAHLGAVVTPVDDEVNAVSDKIQSGSISLGGEEITEGTAMLTVNDADLTDEQKAEFQAQAGNYNVSTFLDIDLDQVFYNGKGDYWQGAEMSELAHEATITLTLEEGVDGNSVILVHKKHDGTYEIIPTTYDAKTRTLAFKTSSFSDYAIASAKTTNANTKDRVLAFFLLFLVSVNASIVMFAQAKKETAKASK